MKSSVGNLAIIKSISPKSVKVKYANEILRSQIMYTYDNPFSRYYMVDVHIEKTDGKPTLYIVTFLHDKPPTSADARKHEID